MWFKDPIESYISTITLQSSHIRYAYGFVLVHMIAPVPVK